MPDCSILTPRFVRSLAVCGLIVFGIGILGWIPGTYSAFGAGQEQVLENPDATSSTGDDQASADQDVRRVVNTLGIVMTGNRFYARKFATSTIVMTGNRFQPKVVATNPIMMTGVTE